MKITIYCRVSTADQSCELQLRELREYAGRQNWEIFHKYVDAAVSGKKASRPALSRLMADARLKRFDAVVVWKLDRFGRSLANLVENIQVLYSHGVRFIAVTQNIDTDQRNPSGRLLLHIMGAFTEFERETIVERVRAGIATAKAAGKHCGRPKRVFRRDDALRLRSEGHSYRAIAAQLDVPVMTVVDSIRKERAHSATA